MQALKARTDGLDGGSGPSGDKPVARRREVGKKLRLSDY